MSFQAVRLFNGSYLRTEDGEICLFDYSSAPTSSQIGLTTDCQIVWRSVPVTAPLSGDSTWLAIGGFYKFAFNSGTNYYIESTVSLKFTGGVVRWEGFFHAVINHISYTPMLACEIRCNIHRNCPSKTISPFGLYTIDGYTIDVPRDSSNTDGTYSYYIIKPSSISIVSP